MVQTFAENFNGGLHESDNSGRKCKLKRMTAHNVSINGFLIQFHVNSKTEVVANKFKVIGSRKLQQLKEIKWIFKVKVKILSASVVKEVLTGRTLPVIVVRVYSKGKSGQYICYVMCVDIKEEKFVTLKQFHMCKSIYKAGFKIEIVDGPAVVLLCGQDLHLFENTCGISLNTQSYSCESLKSDVNDSKILSAQYLETLDTYVIFVYLTDTDNNASVLCLLFNQSQFRLNGSSLVPVEYFSICSALLVQNYELSANNKLSCEMLLGTSEGYIVHLVNGRWKKCNKVFDVPICNIITRTMQLKQQKGKYIVQSDTQASILDENLNVSSLKLGDFIMT